MIRSILKALFVGWVAKKFAQRRGTGYASSSARPLGTNDHRY